MVRSFDFDGLGVRLHVADWLQGPYVYALYSSYGFDKSDIAVLFVGGFGASMVFGTFAGAAADRFGRKRLCQLYCLLYIASCATKHALTRKAGVSHQA